MSEKVRVTVGPRAELGAAIAGALAEAGRSAVRSREKFTVAIAGGSVAEAFLPMLRVVQLPWELVHFFWCDERAVSRASTDSNVGAALKVLQGSPAAMRAQFHAMPADLPDLALAAAAYEQTLAATVGEGFDMVVLGVGEDGHIASLFPGHDALNERNHSVVAVYDSPKPPAARLTLTLPMLAGARTVVVAAFGEGKARVMREAIENSRSPLPVAQLLQQAKRAFVMLDAGAASLLGGAGAPAQ